VYFPWKSTLWHHFGPPVPTINIPKGIFVILGGSELIFGGKVLFTLEITFWVKIMILRKNQLWPPRIINIPIGILMVGAHRPKWYQNAFSWKKNFLTQKVENVHFLTFYGILRHGESGYTLATHFSVARATFGTLQKVEFCYFLFTFAFACEENILLGMLQCLWKS